MFTNLNHRHVFIICFVAIVVFSTIQPIGPNDVSRYLSIVSLAKDNSFIIDEELEKTDTMDKIYVDGHFYSDKPPLFALTFAPIYYAAKSINISVYSKYLYKFSIILILGTLFAFAMSLFYKEYSERFDKHKWLLLLLIFATPYYVFNRVLMSHALVGSLLYISFYCIRKENRFPFMILAGLLSGLAMTYDHGAIFIVLSFILYLILTKKIKELIAFGAIAAIPVLVHLVIVFHLSGSLLPLNMHPEYFNYPGGKWANFSAGLSGGLKHTNPLSLLGYMLALLFMFPFGYQSKGLFLTAPILIFAFIEIVREMREKKIEAISLFAGIFLLFLFYSFTSNNVGGGDYAVRWFIIFMPLCLPYAVKFYDSSGTKKGVRGWFNFALIVSLLISVLYSFISWLGGFTPLF